MHLELERTHVMATINFVLFDIFAAHLAHSYLVTFTLLLKYNTYACSVFVPVPVAQLEQL